LADDRDDARDQGLRQSRRKLAEPEPDALAPIQRLSRSAIQRTGMYRPIRQRTPRSSLGTFVESCTTSTQLHSVTGVLLALEMMWINGGSSIVKQ
jgi:hypothetical protein